VVVEVAKLTGAEHEGVQQLLPGTRAPSAPDLPLLMIGRPQKGVLRMTAAALERIQVLT
jgi:hypothetical protein